MTDLEEVLCARGSCAEASEAAHARRSEIDAAARSTARAGEKTARSEQEQRAARDREREALGREEERAEARGRILGVETARRVSLAVSGKRQAQSEELRLFVEGLLAKMHPADRELARQLIENPEALRGVKVPLPEGGDVEVGTPAFESALAAALAEVRS